MSVIQLEEYNDGKILKKLKYEEDCPKMLLTIVNFVFSDMIQNLMHQLTSKIISKFSPRLMSQDLIEYNGTSFIIL